MEHEDAVGDVLYHAEIVGDHDDGGARPGRADGGEGVEDLNARGHVDGAHRLIGEDHFGLVDDSAGDDHALRLAAGQVVRGALHIAVPAAQRVQRRADALVGQQMLALAALAANRERPGQADRLGHVLARQTRLLRQVGDIPPPLLRRELAAALAFKGERAVRMRVEPGARGQQTRLAGAGRSHQIEDRYPRFHVTAITHRRDAVYPATVVGVPPEEDAYIAEATERIFLAPIRLAVQPEVRDLWMPTAGTAHNLAVVAIERRYEGQAHKVAQSLWGAGQMMFNKYLVVADAATEIRRVEALAALVRRLDPARDLIAAEGVLDVLDHATATPGFGGKLALDLTRAAAREEQPLQLPERFEPCGGVAAAATGFAERWRTLALFVDRRTERVDAAAFFGRNPVRGVKCAVLFDREAEGLTGAELLWLAAADSDPRRDVTVVGEVVVVDARSKRPGVEGHPARFPNVAVASSATVERVDARWVEYGLGETMASPSERYRRLLLSDKAAW